MDFVDLMQCVYLYECESDEYIWLCFLYSTLWEVSLRYSEVDQLDEMDIPFYVFFVCFFLLSKCLIFSFHRLTSSIFLYSPAPSSCLLLNILSSFLAPDGFSPPTLAHATNASLNVSWSAPVNSNAPGPLYYSLQMRTSPQRPIIRWETP